VRGAAQALCGRHDEDETAPGGAICVLSWRGNGNGGNQMKAKLTMAIVGVCIAAASWAPLMIVEAYDRYAMPVGLGLFAFDGSLVGGVIALVGVIGLMIRAARAPKARS
jgi:hypothetical protein